MEQCQASQSNSHTAGQDITTYLQGRKCKFTDFKRLLTIIETISTGTRQHISWRHHSIFVQGLGKTKKTTLVDQINVA
jgi:hypothetical protein